MHETQASLESLIESAGLGVEILHPGGLTITAELAAMCNIGKNDLVLDVASGTGESACYLVEALEAMVVGIDASASMIERAERKAARRDLPLEFKKADAHHLPFRDNTFAAVISECTMSLLNKEQAIREMARVAKPDGYVGIHDICWKEGASDQLKEKLAGIEGERPETLEGWKLLFEQAGLIDVLASDRSQLIPLWIKDSRKRLGLSGLFRIYLRALRTWGLAGIMNIRETERILGSRHVGYAIIVGRKPCHQQVLPFGPGTTNPRGGRRSGLRDENASSLLFPPAIAWQ